MGRIIKFRAWDKREEKMWYADDLKNSHNLWAVGFHGLPIAVDNDSFKENEIVGWNIDHFLELMQFTGLTDKNGVEVYEGDIVTNKLRDVDGRKNGKWEVRYYDNGFYLFELNSVCADFHVWWDRVEVIGNVFENPDLLVVEKVLKEK